MLHRIYFQPIRYGGPLGLEDAHVRVVSRGCLPPVSWWSNLPMACGDGCSWMFAGIVSGQIRPGRVRGCQFTTLPRPPMRGSIIAQTSSTIMPQPGWTYNVSCWVAEEVSDYRHSGIPTREPHEVADGLHVRRAGHSPRSREATKEWEFLSIRVLPPEALYFTLR